MKPQLFVDVDDTLVIYEDLHPVHPYGVYHGIPWHTNKRLLEGIRRFAKESSNSLSVIVWSGGGKDYADYWISYLGLEKIATGCIKDETTYHLIREGDIVVDDMSIGGRRTHGPHEWPEE